MTRRPPVPRASGERPRRSGEPIASAPAAAAASGLNAAISIAGPPSGQPSAGQSTLSYGSAVAGPPQHSQGSLGDKGKAPLLDPQARPFPTLAGTRRLMEPLLGADHSPPGEYVAKGSPGDLLTPPGEFPMVQHSPNEQEGEHDPMAYTPPSIAAPAPNLEMASDPPSELPQDVQPVSVRAAIRGLASHGGPARVLVPAASRSQPLPAALFGPRDSHASGPSVTMALPDDGADDRATHQHPPEALLLQLSPPDGATEAATSLVDFQEGLQQDLQVIYHRLDSLDRRTESQHRTLSGHQQRLGHINGQLADAARTSASLHDLQCSNGALLASLPEILTRMSELGDVLTSLGEDHARTQREVVNVGSLVSQLGIAVRTQHSQVHELLSSLADSIRVLHDKMTLATPSPQGPPRYSSAPAPQEQHGPLIDLSTPAAPPAEAPHVAHHWVGQSQAPPPLSLPQPPSRVLASHGSDSFRAPIPAHLSLQPPQRVPVPLHLAPQPTLQPQQPVVSTPQDPAPQPYPRGSPESQRQYRSPEWRLPWPFLKASYVSPRVRHRQFWAVIEREIPREHERDRSLQQLLKQTDPAIKSALGSAGLDHANSYQDLKRMIERYFEFDLHAYSSGLQSLSHEHKGESLSQLFDRFWDQVVTPARGLPLPLDDNETARIARIFYPSHTHMVSLIKSISQTEADLLDHNVWRSTFEQDPIWRAFGRAPEGAPGAGALPLSIAPGTPNVSAVTPLPDVDDHGGRRPGVRALRAQAPPAWAIEASQLYLGPSFWGPHRHQTLDLRNSASPLLEPLPAMPSYFSPLADLGEEFDDGEDAAAPMIYRDSPLGPVPIASGLPSQPRICTLFSRDAFLHQLADFSPESLSPATGAELAEYSYSSVRSLAIPEDSEASPAEGAGGLPVPPPPHSISPPAPTAPLPYPSPDAPGSHHVVPIPAPHLDPTANASRHPDSGTMPPAHTGQKSSVQDLQQPAPAARVQTAVVQADAPESQLPEPPQGDGQTASAPEQRRGSRSPGRPRGSRSQSPSRARAVNPAPHSPAPPLAPAMQQAPPSARQKLANWNMPPLAFKEVVQLVRDISDRDQLLGALEGLVSEPAPSLVSAARILRIESTSVTRIRLLITGQGHALLNYDPKKECYWFPSTVRQPTETSEAAATRLLQELQFSDCTRSSLTPLGASKTCATFHLPVDPDSVPALEQGHWIPCTVLLAAERKGCTNQGEQLMFTSFGYDIRSLLRQHSRKGQRKSLGARHPGGPRAGNQTDRRLTPRARINQIRRRQHHKFDQQVSPHPWIAGFQPKCSPRQQASDPFALDVTCNGPLLRHSLIPSPEEDTSPPLRVGDKRYGPQDRCEGVLVEAPSQHPTQRTKYLRVRLHGQSPSPAVTIPLHPTEAIAEDFRVNDPVTFRIIRAYITVRSNYHAAFPMACSIRRTAPLADTPKLSIAPHIQPDIQPSEQQRRLAQIMRVATGPAAGRLLQAVRGPRHTVLLAGRHVPCHQDTLADLNALSDEFYLRELKDKLDAAGIFLCKFSMHIGGFQPDSTAVKSVGVLLDVPLQLSQEPEHTVKADLVVCACSCPLLLGAPFHLRYGVGIMNDSFHLRVWLQPREDWSATTRAIDVPFKLKPWYITADGTSLPEDKVSLAALQSPEPAKSLQAAQPEELDSEAATEAP